MTTFVCQGGGNDVMLQWRDSSGTLSGTVEYSHLSGQAPQESVTSSSGDLSGTLNGSAITLTVSFSGPIYGTLDGSTLTLNTPQQDGSFQVGTCTRQTLTGWNKAVAALEGQAASNNSQAQQAGQQASHETSVSDAQTLLTSDVSALAGAANALNTDESLGSDVTAMRHEYTTEQSDFTTEQSDSCDLMSGDAGVVGGDAGVVSGDLESLDGDITALQDGDIAAVTGDITQVQTDLSTLQSLGAAPGTNASPAITAGQKALKSAAAAIALVRGEGKTINTNAQNLAAAAQSYAGSHCS